MSVKRADFFYRAIFGNHSMQYDVTLYVSHQGRVRVARFYVMQKASRTHLRHPDALWRCRSRTRSCTSPAAASSSDASATNGIAAAHSSTTA